MAAPEVDMDSIHPTPNVEDEIYDSDMESDDVETIPITLTHHNQQHTFDLPVSATITDLSEAVFDELSVPPSNQKFMIPKLGFLKYPFANPELAITALQDKKITLMGSTVAEVASITEASKSVPRRHRHKKPSAHRTATRNNTPADLQYTFLQMRPLPHLPNPERSLALLNRLKNDPGVRATMVRHKWTVPLLTEMNPVDHTTSSAEGVTRTLGLNRNKGEVIELRLRTDAYDGYRDYKTIRKTLCHELAHNEFGDHDANFWNLCRKIEKEVEGGDYWKGGRTISEDVYDGPEVYDEDEMVDDHGGWTGGEFVLGGGTPGSSTSGPSSENAGLSRREILARATEERLRRLRFSTTKPPNPSNASAGPGPAGDGSGSPSGDAHKQ